MSQVAVIQMTSLADPQHNLAEAQRLVAAAAAAGAELVVLPEMFLSLDGKRYPQLAADQDWLPILAGWCRQWQIWLVAGAVPLPSGQPGETRVSSACLVLNANGELVARYNKIHLFDAAVGDAQGQYRESERFAPGDDVVVVDTPVGRLGLSICYDVRFPELYRQLRDRGAELICVPAAFTWRTGEAHWEVLLRARAIEQQVYVLAANQCGWHDEKRRTWGHSCVVDPWGRVLAQLDEEPGFALAVIDHPSLADVRHNMPVASHRRL